MIFASIFIMRSTQNLKLVDLKLKLCLYNCAIKWCLKVIKSPNPLNSFLVNQESGTNRKESFATNTFDIPNPVVEI